MAEDKAEKALRKVIINLIPKSICGDGPVCLDEEALHIDISDKLDNRERYFLGGISEEENNFKRWIHYVSQDDFLIFKLEIENIFDAVIVNAKQRKSVQKMLDSALSKYLNRKETI